VRKAQNLNGHGLKFDLPAEYLDTARFAVEAQNGRHVYLWLHPAQHGNLLM